MSDPWDEWTLRRLLHVLADVEGMDELIVSRRRPDDLRFALNCSDLFWWATADAEVVGLDDLDLVEECIADLRQADEKFGFIYFAALYAARKRQMRPQGPWYGYERRKYIAAPIAALFDACGPERTDSPKIPQVAS